ncbi:hypothetical protein HNP86_001084 [Methanococcus maripaludis]|uniref:Uncharacterized protein n=1 Tax=Methanococcus maripaludis TaxID=39152 RepID=A0A7J9NVF0_METMI|nr:hypothetical protein [Methanococcus maripaludis]MBA2850953.1 hypothetical protein [Methanococcus maripaludis]
MKLKFRKGDFISKNGYVIYIIKIHQNGVVEGVANYSCFSRYNDFELKEFEKVSREDLSNTDIMEINKSIKCYNNLKTTVKAVELVV